MTEAHSHHTLTAGRHLFIAIILNAVIFVFEFIGGLLTNSFALISDAMHNLSNFFSLILSYVASKRTIIKKIDF
jgi:cobalt-zinc-cadmium efflux system protein